MWKDLRSNVSLIYFMKNNKKMYQHFHTSFFLSRKKAYLCSHEQLRKPRINYINVQKVYSINKDGRIKRPYQT
ncbi:hypothetical protein EZS27_026250 [termite gut metagenome]|uniref:Uncharacterized protein n=1 Tax=termite gut metagenome TaxID=433724 RepID=A0A5J4QV71_9ZZZZ